MELQLLSQPRETLLLHLSCEGRLGLARAYRDAVACENRHRWPACRPTIALLPNIGGRFAFRPHQLATARYPTHGIAPSHETSTVIPWFKLPGNHEAKY